MNKTLIYYKDFIKELPLKSKYTKDELLIDKFLIDKENNIYVTGESMGILTGIDCRGNSHLSFWLRFYRNYNEKVIKLQTKKQGIKCQSNIDVCL